MRRGKITPKLASNIKINGWVKAYDHTVTGSAETSLTISGLVGDTDKEYKLETRIVSGYNGYVPIWLRINNDGNINYGRQVLYCENTTVAATRDSLSHIPIGSIDALNKILQTETIIHAKSGYVRAIINSANYSVSGTTVTGLEFAGYSWNNTADNITSLVLLSETGGLGIGSSIILWKKVFR